MTPAWINDILNAGLDPSQIAAVDAICSTVRKPRQIACAGCDRIGYCNCYTPDDARHEGLVEVTV